MEEAQLNVKNMRCSILGYLLYGLLIFKKTIAHQNIDAVFVKHLSKASLRKLKIAYFSHFLRVFKELFLMLWLKESFFDNKNFSFEGMQYFEQALAQNKGIILLTGHFYNWELLSAIVHHQSVSNLLNNQHRQFFCIRKKLRFNFLQSAFFEIFENSFVKILDKDKAIRKSFAVLRKKNIVIFPFDLKPKRKSDTWVRTLFLGREAKSYSSLAFLAKKTGAVVIPVGYWHMNHRTCGIEFYPEILWQDADTQDEEILINTQRYNEALEKIILKRPEQWNWIYNRW